MIYCKMVKEDKNQLRRDRDSAMSPYIAQGFEVIADFPNERRVELRKPWTGGMYFIAFLLLCLWIIPGVIYIYVKNKNNKKQILY